MKLIFEPFGHVQSKPDRPHKGTGLGLSLSRSLTELSSGQPRLASEIGKGTCVGIQFPAEKVVPPKDDPTAQGTVLLSRYYCSYCPSSARRTMAQRYWSGQSLNASSCSNASTACSTQNGSDPLTSFLGRAKHQPSAVSPRSPLACNFSSTSKATLEIFSFEGNYFSWRGAT